MSKSYMFCGGGGGKYGKNKIAQRNVKNTKRNSEKKYIRWGCKKKWSVQVQ